MDSPRGLDTAVVGAGMIGAAAARHLAESGKVVALIGPGEPADFSGGTGPFASHYDEARITRISAANSVWADLAAPSVSRYVDIASRSGINFHMPCGLAQSARDPQSAVDAALSRGGSAQLVDPVWLAERYGIALADHHGAFYEDPPAGVISPRKLVAAQTELARLAGASIIGHAATALRKGADGIEILTDHGSVVANQVILATGAYGAELAGASLATERCIRTVALAELADAAPDLPSLIVEAPAHLDLERLYWTPPVPYPDGRHLLKIGGSVTPTRTADTDQDIADWFRSGGSEDEATILLNALRDLLPSATVISTDFKPCVMTYTASDLPYIGFIDDRIAVAVGGNGSAAKSSDEIGRLAASLVTNGWATDDVDASHFIPQLAR